MQGAGSLPKINNYTCYYTNKYINQNSGVVAYVKNIFRNVSVSEPNIIDADCLVVKVDESHAFICIYRSPSFTSITNFINSLDRLLIDLRPVPNTYITGDINIDIRDNIDDVKSEEYLNFLASHCLVPSHTLPTRMNKCYDHFFAKSNVKLLTLVCDSSITDHSTVYLNIPLLSKRFNYNQKRVIQKLNYDMAYKLLLETDWNNLLMLEDPNIVTENFIGNVSDIIKKSTTFTTIPIRKQTLQPWVTPGLLRCMRFRDTLHRKSKKHRMIKTWKLLIDVTEITAIKYSTI